MKNRTSLKSKSPGASLPTVIMVVALMMTMAFTVCAIAFNHLNLSFRSNNNTKAEHLAEAVLALAIEKAANDIENYGVLGTAAEKTIELSFDSYPAGNRGFLSFDPDIATSLGVPFSTNNRSENSVSGSNPKQVVPGQSLHLVARAEVGGAFSTMEAVVEIPKFPYSIASGGAIRSNGGLLVASIRPGTIYDLSLPIHEEDLEPGHLVSNSTSGDDAIVMAGNNKIMGDIQSASGATVEEDTEVFGVMRLNADKVTLPALNASSYDPRGAAPDGPVPGFEPDDSDIQYVNSGAGTLSVKGYNVSESNLTVDTGITLNGGVLFVDGNLTVSSGGVKGKGAIIATGDITILGGGEATTDNEAALIADGNIILRGTPVDKAKFAGLIYTNGNLSAEDMRLAGVFVAAGEDGPMGVPGNVTLKDTELYHVDELAQLELNDEFIIPVEINTTSYNFNDVGNGIYVPLPVSYDTSQLQSNLANYVNPNTGPGEPAYLFKYKAGSVYMTVSGTTGLPVLTTGPDQYVVDGGDLGMMFCGQAVSTEEQAVAAALAYVEAEFTKAGKVMTSSQRTSLANTARAAFNSNAGVFDLGLRAIDYTESLQSGGPTGGGGGAFKWTVDLSDFVNESERMQVRYWARFR
jgi:hypothetical protein